MMMNIDDDHDNDTDDDVYNRALQHIFRVKPPLHRLLPPRLHHPSPSPLRTLGQLQ